MPILPKHPGLKDFQHYVSQLEQERGFADQNVVLKCLMLGEEIGELFKAIRKQQNIKMDQKSVVGTVEEELADIFIFMCAIANRMEIDLETAFRAKEELNKNRIWK